MNRKAKRYSKSIRVSPQANKDIEDIRKMSGWELPTTTIVEQAVAHEAESMRKQKGEKSP